MVQFSTSVIIRGGLLLLVASVLGACGDGGGGEPDPTSPPVVVPPSAWGARQPVELDSTGNMGNANVAVDGAGNAIAVWERTEGANTTIWGKLYIIGTGWTATPVQLSGAIGASAPHVAVNAAGVTIAVWHEANRIKARRYLILTNSLEATQDLGEADANPAVTAEAPKPKIAIDPSGSAIVVWHEFNGTVNNIFANRSVGGIWSGLTPMETEGGNATNPQIAMDAAGNAIAVWQQDSAAGDEEIRGSRYTIAGGWAPFATALDHPTDTEAGVPQIAMNADGAAIIVWRELAAAGGNVIYARRYAAGIWAAPVAVSAVAGDNADAPQIAIDQAGNGVAVWTQSQTVGGKVRVMASRYAANGTRSLAAAIDANDFGDAGSPKIAMNAGGSAFVVWHALDSTLPTEQTRSIWSNRLVVGGTWNPTTAGSLESVAADNASVPMWRLTPMVVPPLCGNKLMVPSRASSPHVSNKEFGALNRGGS
ncbi:MAG: hypothetical protein EXR39_07995 [Betaproteobacteria bacterium]|nr:hypothetical protein [Betaproteobacteria bacterium]